MVMVFEIISLVILLILIYFLIIYLKHVIDLTNYPDGPFPWPVIGNIYQVGSKPFEAFSGLAKTYGSVFSISLGMKRIVVINTIEPAKEALITRGAYFSGRPVMYTGDIMSRGGKDILFADYGKQWMFIRKIAHTSLRMYGDGMEKIENLVVNECDELSKRLREAQEKPVLLQNQIGVSVLNVICYMVFGVRYSPDDEEFQTILKFCNLMVTSLNNGDPVAFLPWLRFFPLKSITSLRECIKLRDPFFRKQLMKHKASFNPDNIRDLTDSLLDVSGKKELWGNADFTEISDDQIEMVINDIFVAGFETTTQTLLWAFIYLLHWPQYQDRIYQEIFHNVGIKRKPELTDKPSLHFLQAVLQETLRLSSLALLAAPHKATQNSIIDGKFIPKDTFVFFNLWNIHHDERHWDKPNEFNPYRWLDDDGKYTSEKCASFLPFSAGRRVCLGEAMAKTELFLLLSRIISEFKIVPDPNGPLPKLEGQVGLTLSPYPFKAIFKRRNWFDM